MDDLLLTLAGHPVLQTLALFLGPFVLEEAALVAGAAIAAAGELPAGVAFSALYAGMVVSDWLLYLLGRLAWSFPYLQRRISDRHLEIGKEFLAQSQLGAAVTARLIPWMLFPIFVACGFLRIGFLRFALANAIIAFVYTTVLFSALYLFDLLLFEHLDGWGWVAIGAICLSVVWLSHHTAKKWQTKRGLAAAANKKSLPPTT